MDGHCSFTRPWHRLRAANAEITDLFQDVLPRHKRQLLVYTCIALIDIHEPALRSLYVMRNLRSCIRYRSALNL